jgi:HD-GYP domain-containing protein (c-di-GMP phosphodiesterase class II)
VAVGMVIFIVLAINELMGFYVNKFHVFGVQLCLGLVFLMVATVVQTLHDETQAYDIREKNRTAMTIKTIETIAGAIDARDEYTGGHSERVGMYAARLAREMAADYDFSEEDILRIQYVGLVHDIGKIGVADNVLNKSGRLSDEEYALMKKHTEIGYEIMSSLGDGIEGLLDGIRYHHERFDGKGYPDGLADTDIPLIARILTLADSYDAMTSNRIYRNHLPDERVRNEILNGAGTQFDPALVPIFIRLMDSGELNMEAYSVEDTGMTQQGKNAIRLEFKLQNDLMAGMKIANPSHIRMLCYIMKLMERKGKEYQVLIVESDDDQTKVRDELRKYLAAHDLIVSYEANSYLVAMYDVDEGEKQKYMDSIKYTAVSLF